MDNILSNEVLIKKLIKTVKKVVKSKKCEKILKEAKQISNTNTFFWKKLISNDKKVKILFKLIISHLLSQKDMNKILSYIYLKKINKKTKKKIVKEKIIMGYVARSTKQIIEYIKKKMRKQNINRKK